MSSYLQRLAQVFAQNVGNQLSEYTFVFPNRRAGLFFRRYLGKALSQPIFSPRVVTINECFASLSELCVTDQLTLLLRLYTIYQSLRPNAESIEQFLHWGKMMLADFSEIDNHLVSNVESLYEAVKDLHNIDDHFISLTDAQRNAIKKFWGDFYASSDKKNNQLHHRFVRTWELLYPLYKGLTDSLLQDNLAYEGLLHRQVIEHWDSIPAERFESHYVFIGFNALTESERQLLLHLRERGCADFYFDYEDAYLSDPAHFPFALRNTYTHGCRASKNNIAISRLYHRRSPRSISRIGSSISIRHSRKHRFHANCSSSARRAIADSAT